LFGIKDPDLFDVDGNYTGTEHSAILARNYNNSVLWDTDGPRFYLTDADDNIVYHPELSFHTKRDASNRELFETRTQIYSTQTAIILDPSITINHMLVTRITIICVMRTVIISIIY